MTTDDSPNRSTLKGARRREQILAIAMRRFARDGSRGTSLAQIAADAGVTQAGLLYYFPSKEALLNAVLDDRDREDGWSSAPPSLPIDVLLNTVVAFVSTWPDDPEIIGMFTVLLIENLAPDAQLHDRLLARYQGILDLTRESLRIARARGEITQNIDPTAKAIEIIAFLNGLEASWLLDPTISIQDAVRGWAAGQRLSLGLSSS